jgi:hypothetical protein
MNEDPHRIVADAAGAVGLNEHDQLTAPCAFFQSLHQIKIALRSSAARSESTGELEP